MAFQYKEFQPNFEKQVHSDQQLRTFYDPKNQKFDVRHKKKLQLLKYGQPVLKSLDIQSQKLDGMVNSKSIFKYPMTVQNQDHYKNDDSLHLRNNISKEINKKLIESESKKINMDSNYQTFNSKNLVNEQLQLSQNNFANSKNQFYSIPNLGYVIPTKEFEKPFFLPEKYKKSLGQPKKPLIFMKHRKLIENCVNDIQNKIIQDSNNDSDSYIKQNLSPAKSEVAVQYLESNVNARVIVDEIKKINFQQDIFRRKQTGSDKKKIPPREKTPENVRQFPFQMTLKGSSQSQNTLIQGPSQNKLQHIQNKILLALGYNVSDFMIAQSLKQHLNSIKQFKILTKSYEDKVEFLKKFFGLKNLKIAQKTFISILNLLSSKSQDPKTWMEQRLKEFSYEQIIQQNFENINILKFSEYLLNNHVIIDTLIQLIFQ